MKRKTFNEAPADELLPETWTWVSPDELADDKPYSIGIGPFGSNLLKSDYQASGVRLVFVKNIRAVDFSDVNSRYVTPEKAAELHQHAISGGELLITKMGDPPGDVAIYPQDAGPAVITSDCIKLKVSPEISSEQFLEAAVRSPVVKKQILDITTGVAHLKVSLDRFRQIAVPIPPLPEQRRIVAKLDRLSARSAAARDHLARTTKLATRAKQAVLSAAFSGDETSQWRAQNGISAKDSAATISALQDQRQELVGAAGKLRKGKGTSPDHHRNPVEVSVPEEWSLSSLEHVTSPLRLIQYGILKPGQDVPGGVPYVKVMNIRDDEVKLDTIRHTTPEIHANYLRSSLREGDLLLTIRGTVGRLAFVPQELDGGNITQDTVRIDVLPAMCPRFVFWYLHSPMAERYFRENQKGVAVRGINVGDVRPMEIPVPSRAEQDEVVRRIEAAFSRIDRMTEEASRAAHLLDRLDERLLAKAFRGELVPQDPDDEPAEALLTRIRESRAAAPKAKRGRRRKAEA